MTKPKVNMLLKLAQLMEDEIKSFGQSFKAANDKQEFISQLGCFYLLQQEKRNVYNDILDDLGITNHHLEIVELHIFNNLITAQEQKDSDLLNAMVDFIIEKYVDVSLIIYLNNTHFNVALVCK